MSINGTVQGHLMKLFPRGTRKRTPGRPANERVADWKDCPGWPPDVFAAACYLIERSGAYEYMQWSEDQEEYGDPFGVYSTNRVHLVSAGAAWAFTLDQYPRAKRTDAARRAVYAYRKASPAPTRTNILNLKVDRQELWKTLIECQEPVLLKPSAQPLTDIDLPGWWRAAIRLAIVADEASQSICFHHASIGSLTAVQHEMFRQMRIMKRENLALWTLLSGDIDHSLVNVLPKSLTTSVGWTLRSLSHHLAFVPPRGMLTANWNFTIRRPPPCVATEDVDSRPIRNLNLLLVPFPFTVRADCFVEGVRLLTDREHGEFQVIQNWISRTPGFSDDMVQFMLELCKNAKEERLDVHGVILPEGALDWGLFDNISGSLARHAETGQEFEFIISGLTAHEMNSVQDPAFDGNFVAVRGKLPGLEDTSAHSTKWMWNGSWHYQFARMKHHRWKLDARQIERYGLGHRFESKERKFWWERFPMQHRRIDLFSPRAGMTIATLVCEDLARNDPCQGAIRAIGPSLVVALLMDGPQTAYRWPAHYAGVLADDPGCAVLTLTNFGMIARGAARDSSRSRSVAFWKDASGQHQELQLPEGFHALLVSLRGAVRKQKTLDGRGSEAVELRLQNVLPVRANPALFAKIA